MVIEVRVLVMNLFWWVMQFSWVSPMYMLLSSVWLSPVHLSQVNLILRDKAGWAEGNVFFPQRGMSWPVGGQLAWIHLRIPVSTGVHTYVYTHRHFLWMGHTPNHHPSRWSPLSSPSASSGPSLPVLPTHMRGPGELSLGDWALTWVVSQGIPGSSF